jgi:hypothetical protein
MRCTNELGAGMLAVAGLVVLTACGGASGSAPTSPPAAAAGFAAAIPDLPDTTQDKAEVLHQKAENWLADCMKRKGFTYVPDKPEVYDAKEGLFVNRRSLLQPDAVVRPLRQKYGFGVAAQRVYPNDPTIVVPPDDGKEKPNNMIRAGLDAAARQKYDEAMGLEGKTGAKVDGCRDQAYRKFSRRADFAGKRAEDESTWEKFTTDPQVVQAAKKYADCLRGKRYQITSSKPGDVEKFMRNLVRPMEVPAAGDEDPTAGSGSANEELAAEIKKAMDDLDCRGSYAEIVRTRYPQVVMIDLSSVG